MSFKCDVSLSFRQKIANTNAIKKITQQSQKLPMNFVSCKQIWIFELSSSINNTRHLNFTCIRVYFAFLLFTCIIFCFNSPTLIYSMSNPRNHNCKQFSYLPKSHLIILLNSMDFYVENSHLFIQVLQVLQVLLFPFFVYFFVEHLIEITITSFYFRILSHYIYTKTEPNRYPFAMYNTDKRTKRYGFSYSERASKMKTLQMTQPNVRWPDEIETNETETAIEILFVAFQLAFVHSFVRFICFICFMLLFFSCAVVCVCLCIHCSALNFHSNACTFNWR